jgi:hypothetical protein
MALSHNPSLVTEGLIIYLDANNTSSYAGTGTTWYDLSGNGRHASLISSPSYEGFGGGKYLSFDGSTNYATIPYTITDNLITVSFWYYSKVCSSNSSTDALISNYEPVVTGFDVRLITPTSLQLDLKIGSTFPNLSFGTIANNTWYHVAFTYDGATLKAFMNGNVVSSTSATGTRANGTQICIATSAVDTNRKATCGIPQVMIYNRALSDAEMLQNYNATKGRYIVNENIVRNGLILNLDAGNTRSYPGTGNTAYDIAGTGNTATLVNGVGFNNANNGSFLFDGTNDQISTSNIDLSATNKVTVSCWVKVLNYRETADSSNIVFEFSSNFNSNTGAFVAAFADGSAVYSSTYPVVLGIRGNSGYNLAGYSKTLVNDLSWHHWTCIFDTSLSGNENTLYIDGVSRTAISTPLQADNSANFGNYKLFIGNRDTSTIAGNANIADLKLYNRALTAQEVKQNYNATKNRYGLS